MGNDKKIKAQHASGTLSFHPLTDARGLELMRDAGYTHVTINGSWFQIAVAIRKTELAEGLARIYPGFVSL